MARAVFHVVKLPYVVFDLGEIVDWLEWETRAQWKLGVGNGGDWLAGIFEEVEVHFFDVTDAVHFKLRWF